MMPAATRKLSRTFQVTRFLGRLPASWDGRPVPGSWLEPLCGVLVTPSECSAPAPKVVGLTLSQLDMNAAASQKMYRTVQERGLTSRHSYRDANPFTLS